MSTPDKAPAGIAGKFLTFQVAEEEYGIEITTFQESLGQSIYPTTLDILGNVQIFVSNEQAENARKLLEEYHNAKEE